MWHLYLDESGDLGFDFVNKKPSKYFTVTVVAVSDIQRNTLDQIPFEKALSRINLFIDKSKSRKEIVEFNNYIVRQLQGRIDPKVPLDIEHKHSYEHMGLQIADLFSWGIFRKYEKSDTGWFDVFKEKVLFDEMFL